MGLKVLPPKDSSLQPLWCPTDRADFKNGSAFARIGMQIAAGVPLECDESPNFQTFRIGLFGLDKLLNVDRTVSYLDKALKELR